MGDNFLAEFISTFEISIQAYLSNSLPVISHRLSALYLIPYINTIKEALACEVIEVISVRVEIFEG